MHQNVVGRPDEPTSQLLALLFQQSRFDSDVHDGHRVHLPQVLEECAQNVSFSSSLNHKQAGNYNDICVHDSTEECVVLAIADEFFLFACTQLIVLVGVSLEDIGDAIQETASESIDLTVSAISFFR